jgi:diguanylate cyclase (GGDEF)-like protein
MNDSLREKFINEFTASAMITEKVNLITSDELVVLISADPQLILDQANLLLKEIEQKQFVFFDRNQEGNLYYTIGRAYNVMSNLEEALRSFTTAMYAFQSTKNVEMEAKCLSSIGGVYEKAGDYTTTYDYTYTALEKALKTGNRLLEARLMNDLGYTHVILGEYDKAMNYLIPCVQYLESSEDALLLSFAKDSLAHAYFGLGRIEEALENEKQAVELSRQDGNWYGVASFLGYIGTIYNARGEHEQALACVDDAQRIAEERGYEMECCNAHRYRAEIFTAMGKYDKAIEEYKVGVDIAKRIRTLRLLYEMYEAMAEVCKLNDDYKNALHYFEMYHAAKDAALKERETQERRYRQVIDQAKVARREADLLQIKNDQLENEINERKLLQQKLEQLAKTDPLTNLINRRAFFTQAALAYERARRYQEPFGIILFDLDLFKEVNDTYGHQIGDQVLAKLGHRLKELAGEEDLVCRFGGEEFILLIGGADINKAHDFAKRIKQMMTEPVETAEKSIHIHASYGVSAFDPTAVVSLDKLIERADDAMYYSKENGRNRITISSDRSGSGVLNFSRVGLQSIFTPAQTKKGRGKK